MSEETIEILAKGAAFAALFWISSATVAFTVVVPKQLRRIADLLEEYLMKGDGDSG